MLRVILIAVAVVVALTIVMPIFLASAAVVMFKNKESFAAAPATVESKRETYERMLAADLSGAVTKDVAMAAIRKIHEREAVNVRNPNAKRLHNAAIDRMIADANAKFERSPTAEF
jgi:hypothetical protein